MEAVSVSLASDSVDSSFDTVKLWKLLTILHLKREKTSVKGLKENAKKLSVNGETLQIVYEMLKQWLKLIV